MLGREIGAMERILDVLSARNSVLASNLANSDTPGYKASDFDFRRVMVDAIAEFEERGRVSPMAPPDLYETPAINPSQDGNSVSMEVEMTKMSENTMLYSVMAQLLGMKLGLVRSAVTDAR